MSHSCLASRNQEIFSHSIGFARITFPQVLQQLVPAELLLQKGGSLRN
jgi:hypothetical protein